MTIAVSSVEELIDQFRSGLIALIPVAERAGIVWNGPGVYDPWENIERVLFASIIISVVEYACNGPFYPLATYGFSYPDYAALSYFSDTRTETVEQRLAFLDIQTSGEAFDTVRFIELDCLLRPTGVLVERPFSQVRLQLVATTKDDVRYLDAIEFNG